jgi:hypothetical protein
MAAPTAADLSELEIEVLGWLLDDYESPSSITDDIARGLDRPVTEAEVSETLRGLVRKGLAAAFRYNKEAEAFEPIELSPDMASDGLWYLALPRGRSEIDQAAI